MDCIYTALSYLKRQSALEFNPDSVSYVFLYAYLCHKFSQVYLHQKKKKTPNKELHLQSEHHLEKIFIPRNILKQQTYCCVGQAEDRCL